VHQRDKVQEWKIQSKFEAWESVRRSIYLGTFDPIINAPFWGPLVCYSLNGGKSNVYFSDSGYGWTWFSDVVFLLPVGRHSFHQPPIPLDADDSVQLLIDGFHGERHFGRLSSD
jgi:hypothetical protein